VEDFMMVRLLVLGTLALLSFTPANAANDSAGAACLQSCRTNLKKSGQWNSYPSGYCRSKCDYSVGAQKR
jgi:hypothetical protein